MKTELYIKIDSLSHSELLTGLRRENRHLRCVVCGKLWRVGEVYRRDDRFFNAELAAENHVDAEHGGMLRILLELPKKQTGLTDTQRQLMQQLALKRSDREIARQMGGKAESTIRNHRFQLKKRVTEARILIALAGLIDQQEDSPMSFISYHADIPTTDERIMTTQTEADRILFRCLESSSELRLKRFPKKEKEKLVILKRITEIFDATARYNEKEINTLLEPIYADYVTIRRYLIEYRFLKRKPDGSEYWVNAC